MSFWKDRRVFVTGATGLLGSAIVRELVSRSARVTCLVRDWIPESDLVGSGTLSRVNCVRGDLDDFSLLLRAVNEHEIDSVFHLGAQTIVSTAAGSPLSTFESNIRGTWNLLEACARAGGKVERIVVASSDKAYGASDTLPYTEDMPLAGRSPYEVSKSCADLIAQSYHTSFGLPVAITRCGNLFGGGDLNFNRLVPGTICTVLAGEAPVIRSDGKLVRDYFWVEDAVEANLVLGEALPRADVSGEAFNFGSEEPLSVMDVVRRILKLLGREDLDPVILNEGESEIAAQHLDCSKARRVLDWKPRHGFDEGLNQTIDWYRRHVERGES